MARRSKKESAHEIIEDKMKARGIPPSHWYVAEGPVRLVYLGKGKEGKEKKEFRIDRRLSAEKLGNWLDEHVGYNVVEEDLPI